MLSWEGKEVGLRVKSNFHCGTTDILDKAILCRVGGSCPVHCRKFSSIPGLHLLDTSRTSVLTTEVSPDIAKYPLGPKITIEHHHVKSLEFLAFPG